MGRRSLAVERRRQIINVAIQCMATHGVAGTTLERIADMAGMARGHVRHYVGNRDELLIDSARVFFFGDEAAEEKDLSVLLRERPIIAADTNMRDTIDYLFGEFAAPGSDNAAAIAFVDASRTMPDIHEIVLSAYLSIQTALTRLLEQQHPSANADWCRRTAYSVLILAIGNTFMTDLEHTTERIEDARSAAEELIERR